MKKICLAVAALFVGGEAAYGLVGGQVFYSYRMQKKDDDDHSAHFPKIATHLSPLPLVPVGLGVMFIPWLGYSADADKSEDSASGMELAVELVGWLPMIPIVTPYAKLNYTVWGHKKTTYTEESGLLDTEQKVGGMELGLGVKYDVMPLVSVLAEVSQGLRTLEGTPGNEDKDFHATTFSLGVEVGI